jgi:hypothetical protein
MFDRMMLQGRLVGNLDAVNELLLSGAPAQIDMSQTGPRRMQMPLTLDLLGFH